MPERLGVANALPHPDNVRPGWTLPGWTLSGWTQPAGKTGRRISVLILDESTNYLDIPSVAALEEMFSEYEGVLVFVSYDEEFIRACATEILEVKGGKTISYMGTPEEFLHGVPAIRNCLIRIKNMRC